MLVLAGFAQHEYVILNFYPFTLIYHIKFKKKDILFPQMSDNHYQNITQP